MCSQTSHDPAKADSAGDAKSYSEHAPATGGAATEVSRLRFELLRSALYHDMSERGALQVNRLAQFATVFLGSGAFAAIAAALPIAGLVASAMVACIGGAQLVWDFAGAAYKHAALKQKFFALLSEAERGGDPSDLISRATLLYADEPPISHRLNRRAHNRAGASVYGDNFTKV